MRDIKKTVEAAIGDAFRALPREALEKIAAGYCPESEDDQHCVHWWDCEPCHWCGFGGGGEDCDCPRHNPELERVQGT